MVAKLALPMTRLAIMRPATVTVMRQRLQLLGTGLVMRGMQLAGQVRAAKIIGERHALLAQLRQLGAPLGDQVVLVRVLDRFGHLLQPRLETGFHELIEVPVQHRRRCCPPRRWCAGP